MTLTTQELAEMVLEMFAGQARYFKARNNLNLIASKKAEAALKKICLEIVEPPKRPPLSLFTETSEEKE